MYYVYHLIDPRTGAVFYVGKGIRGRVAEHERDAKAGVEHPKCERIRAIWAADLQVGKQKIKHFADEQDAYDFEAQEVERIGLVNLTNLVPGGGSARSPSPVPPIKVARTMLRYMASFIHLRARGKTLSYPWGETCEALLKSSIPKLAKKFGEDFVRTEFSKYNIEPVFIDGAAV